MKTTTLKLLQKAIDVVIFTNIRPSPLLIQELREVPWGVFQTPHTSPGSTVVEQGVPMDDNKPHRALRKFGLRSGTYAAACHIVADMLDVMVSRWCDTGVFEPVGGERNFIIQLTYTVMKGARWLLRRSIRYL